MNAITFKMTFYRMVNRLIDKSPYLVKLRYNRAYKIAIAYEEQKKRECRAEMKLYKDGKAKQATTKVCYVYPSYGFKHGPYVAEIFNSRNFNDKPWFTTKKES